MISPKTSQSAQDAEQNLDLAVRSTQKAISSLCMDINSAPTLEKKEALANARLAYAAMIQAQAYGARAMEGLVPSDGGISPRFGGS